MNQTNTTQLCDSFLTSRVSNETLQDALQLQLCPDFITVPIVTGTVSSIQILFSAFIMLLVCIRRNNDPIKSRSAFVTNFAIGIQSLGIFIIMLRLMVGRSYFPCAIGTFVFTQGCFFVMIPYVMKLYRLFVVMRMNQLKEQFSKQSSETEISQDQQPSTNEFELLHQQIEQAEQIIEATAAQSSEETPSDLPTNTPRKENDEPAAATVQQGQEPSIEVIPLDKPTVVDVIGKNDYFSKTQHVSLQRRIKILQCMVHPISILWIPITSFVIHSFVFLFGALLEVALQQPILVYTGNSFVFDTGCGISSVLVGIMGVDIFIHCIIIFVLLILNCRTKDLFFIKLEAICMLIIYGILMVIFVVLGFIPFVYTFSDYIVPYGLVMVLGPFFEAILTGLIPLLQTCTKNKNRNHSSQKDALQNKEDDLQGLQKILNHGPMRMEFLNFAKSSFCPESILCWQEISKYRQTKLRRRRIAIYEHIVVTFLQNNSPLELNLPLESRSEFINYFETNLKEEHRSLTIQRSRKSFALNTYLEQNHQTFPAECLDKLKTMVEYNSLDLFLRFKTVSRVKKFLKETNKS